MVQRDLFSLQDEKKHGTRKRKLPMHMQFQRFLEWRDMLINIPSFFTRRLGNMFGGRRFWIMLPGYNITFSLSMANSARSCPN